MMKYESLAERKATILTATIILIVPILFNIIYFAKHDIVLNTIPASKQLEIRIEVDKNMLSNNSVGNDWFFDIDVNGTKFKYNDDYKILTVDCNSTLKLNAEVEESDNVPDRGRGSIDVDLTRLDYTKDNTFIIPVTVREQRGRYSGNTAEWEIVFKVMRDMNFWDIVFG